MADKDNDVKQVIILDEGRKEEDTDEALELLEQIDEYLLEEGQTDYKPREKVRRRPRQYRHGKPVSSGLRKLIIALSVSLIILAVVIFIAVGNLDMGYREPVKIYEAYLNNPDFDDEELSFACGNGLAKHQFERLRKIQHGFSDYNDALEASRRKNADNYNETCVLYGEGRKYSITVDDAVPLSDNDLLMLTADFEGLIKDLSESSYARASDPELAAAVSDLTDKVNNAHITRGFRLYCTQSIRGIMDDGPINDVNRCEFTVVRLNGHWIMWDRIYDIFKMTF